MDFLSAFSGLERIAIIGGAMLVGYWGYRLLATDRTPALIFMGVACAVLFAVLFTGGSHMKIVGESYQLATAVPADPIGEAAAPEIELVDQIVAPPSPSASVEPIAASEETVAQIVPEPVPDEPAATAATPEVSDLLSSQELGGRIVSVKSESVTLEWSPNQ